MNILFVCTGNTCRSPMAQAYFNTRAENLDLECYSDSAGIAAFNGLPASASAVEAMEELFQIDLSSHSSKQVDSLLLLQSDLVLAMTPMQKRALQEAFPDSTRKIFTLSEYGRILEPERAQELPLEISDPYGNVLSEYKQTIRQIAALVDMLIDHVCKM